MASGGIIRQRSLPDIARQGGPSGRIISEFTLNGAADVSNTTDFDILVKDGQIPGWSSIHKYGYNPDVDRTSTPEDIWFFGGVYSGFLASAETLSIVSTSTADASPSGTGARTVLVEGLDDNFLYKSETVSMNGTTPVNLTGNWFRQNRTSITTVGSGGVNAGDITITSGSTASTMSRIGAGIGRTLLVAYTIPADKRGYLSSASCSLSKKTASYLVWEIAANEADAATFTRKGWQILHRDSAQDRAPTQFRSPIPLPPLTDVRMRALEVSADNSAASGWFDIFLLG